MKSATFLFLFSIASIMSTEVYGGQRITVKKRGYVMYRQVNDTITKTHGQYIYISAMPKKSPNIYNQMEMIDGSKGIAHLSGGIRVSESRGGLADYTNTPPIFNIQGGLKSDERKPIPFSTITVGTNTYTYAQMMSSGSGQISSYQNGPISQYSSVFDHACQPVAMSDSTGNILFNTSMYFPSILNVTTEPGYDSSHKTIRVNSKTDGITLRWNTDTSNLNGVEIVLKELTLNGRVPDRIYIFTVPDNGSFTISSKYLSDFASHRLEDQKHSNMQAHIYRGDCKLLSGLDGRRYQTSDYSKWDLYFMVE